MTFRIMRYLLYILIIMMSTPQSLFAQKTAIQVFYTQRTKVPKSIEQIENATIRRSVIEKLKQRPAETYLLYDNRKEYAFSKAVISDEGTLSLEGSGALYCNRQTKQKISVEKILDKQFVVEDSVAGYRWDIQFEETKEVLGKRCVKAVLTDKKEVVAWFCDEIPVQVGPLGYNGLPGLVLALETSTAIYEATAVNAAPDEVRIIVPEKGRMPAVEFKRLRDKKLKDFSASQGTEVIILE